MTPEGYRRLRLATHRQAIIEMERDYYIHWSLERDIVLLLAQGDDYGFTVGWPEHKDFAGVPGWPDFQTRLRDWKN